jgi:hypothetical protein
MKRNKPASLSCMRRSTIVALVALSAISISTDSLAGRSGGVGGFRYKVEDQGGGGIVSQPTGSLMGGNGVSAEPQWAGPPDTFEPTSRNARVEILLTRWMNRLLLILHRGR